MSLRDTDQNTLRTDITFIQLQTKQDKVYFPKNLKCIQRFYAEHVTVRGSA